MTAPHPLEEVSSAAQDIATTVTGSSGPIEVVGEAAGIVPEPVEASEPNITASSTSNVSVGIPADEPHGPEAVETCRTRLAEVLLRFPMFGILLFFWFAFYTLMLGPNVAVTVVNVVLNMTCMPLFCFSISLI